MGEGRETKTLGEWKSRVGTKVAAGAAVGAMGGAFAATLRQLSLVGTAFNMGANFGIFAGLCGTTQELFRASTNASEITLLNSLASGFLTGGFLCGINRGPRSILPGALGFGTAVGLAHFVDENYLRSQETFKRTLVSLDLLDIPDKEEKRRLMEGEVSQHQSWSLSNLWPSSIPAPIRIHSQEEVEELAKLRRKQLKDRMNEE